MGAIGAIVGVIVLFACISVFDPTASSPAPKPQQRVAYDPVCAGMWNRAVPLAAQQPSGSFAPGQTRRAWVYRDVNGCAVVLEGGQRWEYEVGGWMGLYPTAAGAPNAVMGPGATVQPAP